MLGLSRRNSVPQGVAAGVDHGFDGGVVDVLVVHRADDFRPPELELVDLVILQ